MSKDLKKRGFNFVGLNHLLRLHGRLPGWVNDHAVECFRHDAV